MARTFSLADILSMTTGILLSRRHVDGLYDVANFMTGDDVYTHQLPRAADACGAALLAQHPQLRDVRPPTDIDVPDLMAWLVNAEREYGEELPVSPLAAGVWERRNPIEELCDRIGSDRVFVVNPEAL